MCCFLCGLCSHRGRALCWAALEDANRVGVLKNTQDKTIWSWFPPLKGLYTLFTVIKSCCEGFTAVMKSYGAFLAMLPNFDARFDRTIVQLARLSLFRYSETKSGLKFYVGFCEQSWTDFVEFWTSETWHGISFVCNMCSLCVLFLWGSFEN